MISKKRQNKSLGDLLVENGLISDSQLTDALNIQKSTGKKIGEILIDEGIVDEKQIIKVLEFHLGVPYVDLDKFFIDREIPRMISEKLARRCTLIPIREERGKLIVAMADPLNIFAMDDLKIATGYEIDPVIAARQDILKAIDQYYETESVEKVLEEFKENYRVDNINDVDEEALNEINNAPVVKLVNFIIKQAIKMKASDIHIEPFERFIRVRFRVDGDLQEIMTPSKLAHSNIVTRIKIMGKMDITEKRLPQDGRVETIIDGKEVDLRLSTLPTVYGEKVAIRLLDRSSFLLSKKQLGFTDDNLRLFDEIIKSPNGMLLVTGPAGSGKSTTLYAILKELNEIHRNIITVEDPVEYQLEGINQVQVNVKAGLTFANGLRSILRQDPDIIMIGEIRDSETAQIAVRAAITGHLVLSTMHTNDTASTVSRLVDMGIEPYLVSSSLIGIIAQRLVKRICKNCLISYTANDLERNVLEIDQERKLTLYRGKGCNLCSYTGYSGRIAIHEVMAVNKEIRMLIDKGGSIDEIRQRGREYGMVSLKRNCKNLVEEGITTLDELIRVAYSLD